MRGGEGGLRRGKEKDEKEQSRRSSRGGVEGVASERGEGVQEGEASAEGGEGLRTLNPSRALGRIGGVHENER